MTVSVQEADFNVADETAHLTDGNTDIGAVVTFTGLVRGGTDTNPAATMTLEHYPGMTETELERIEAEAHNRWPLAATRIVHRVGPLQPGENIVLVIAASRHRQAAFEAAAFLMDYLKTKAPFWKKETDTAGQGAWVDARESDNIATDRWQNPSKTRR